MSITPTLRLCTSEDAQTLALIGAATLLESFAGFVPGHALLGHCDRYHHASVYLGYLAKPETRIWLAEVEPGAAPVGYAMLTTPELPTIEVFPTDIELKRIYLFSRFRSAPVLDAAGHPIPSLRPAQALMDAAVADARALQRTRLLLGTHANNLRAIAFYRRNGFVEVGTRTFQVGTQVCYDLIFAKPL